MRSLLILFLFTLWGTFSVQVNAQNTSLASTQTQLLYHTFESLHYSPRVVNDSLSANIFDKLIETMDPRHLYFTEADYHALAAYRLHMNLVLKGKDTTFFPLLFRTYKDALLRAQQIITTVLANPFDYQVQEIYKTSDYTSGFAPTAKMHELRWRKWLKYKTLWRMADMTGLQEYTPATLSAFLANEPAARGKVKVIEGRKITRILEHPEGYEAHLVNDFLNVIATCYDPHSMYMSRTDLENFQAHLSTDGFSFGLDLSENENGDIEVARITPGGPAWKSNEIHKGDILLSLQWEGKNLIDLTGAYAYEAEEIMNASNGGKLEFTFRKTDGQENKIFLSKEKLQTDENIVKSVILQGKYKIGYISLPGFYTEWEDDGGLGCSNDVAREILKLKEEHIDGLIIDVRYNGGGSLLEGMNLAGIFINEGPLFIMTNRNEKPQVMKDMNRGTVYDGPLVVMVNGQSASASELFASTLQDYNRAVIVGSSTYGKATGQRIMSIDSTDAERSVDFSSPDSPYGYASVTVHKLYRVTGKSAQLSGVTPDVVLPDIYDCIEYKESTLEYALPGDSVNKKTYFIPLPAYPKAALQANSKKRVKDKKGFNLITNFVDTMLVLNKEGQEKGVWLQSKAFAWRAYRYTRAEKALEEYDVDSVVTYQAVNSKYEKEVIQIDAYSQELNSIYIDQITHDIYIEESYLILSDLIQLTQK